MSFIFAFAAQKYTFFLTYANKRAKKHPNECFFGDMGKIGLKFGQDMVRCYGGATGPDTTQVKSSN